MRFLPFLLLLAACGTSTPDAVSPPNVLFIIADDMGWGDLSLHNNPNLATPNLDRLARRGVRFEHFYVSPVCSPTRAEILSGRHALEVSVTGTGAGRERLDTGVVLLPELLRESGYATAAFGKWHNGTQPPYHPRSRGFEQFFGFTSGHWGQYYDAPLLESDDELVTGTGFLPDELTSRAIQYIDAQNERPWFVWLAYPTPHSPMQIKGQYWHNQRENPLALRYTGPHTEDTTFTKAALAMVENIDANVGRLLQTLRELRLAENTLVVFLSDNGPNNWRWNGDMRGRKGSTDEGGVRSPLFMRHLGRLPEDWSVRQIVSARDLLPTLAAYTNVNAPGDLPGRSLLPLLEKTATDWPQRTITNQWREDISVRSADFRLAADSSLYDVRQAAAAQTDVRSDYPEVANALETVRTDFRRTVVQPHLVPDTRPFAVGHPSGTRTLLPARDATTTPGIERSSRWPNDSYFTNWTDTSAYVQWPVMVHTPGIYEATLYYTLRPADAGTLLQLTAKEARTQSVAPVVHDPPLLGTKADRVPREESYTKDFRPVALGKLDLRAGLDTLRLRAPVIPSAQAVDVRLLVLRHPAGR